MFERNDKFKEPIVHTSIASYPQKEWNRPCDFHNRVLCM